MIGDRLKDHSTYERMLDDEGRRCWTLEYAETDGIGFHLDVLPSIPDDAPSKTRLVVAGVADQYVDQSIAITDRVNPAEYIWAEGGSNPRGFAQWFDSLNIGTWNRVAIQQKQLIAESNQSIYASVDAVPDALVRSPLQRAIQILKRHRDVRFSGHRWEQEKPISMIITTLAAIAYESQMDIEAALMGILDKIEDYTTSGLIQHRDGEWFIPNPVNPSENFANRWNDPGSNRAAAFFEWVAWVRQDLSTAREKAFETDSRECLAESLNTRLPRMASGAPVVLAEEEVPTLGSTSHKQRPPWSMDLRYRVSVTGQVRSSLKAVKNLWRLTGRPIPKSYGIAFHADTNTPAPYEVKWQVVNTGQEAAADGPGQLRGGFDDSEPPHSNTRLERTSYNGTHTIEAFVIKDGVCVAKSGPMDVRVGQR
tara:strand:- start:1043 stop:2311 length:1269 start_codon:yes stop_codon:yes gene_type:complete